VLAAVLVAAGRLLVRAIAPLANARLFPLRHAVLHLSRPGNQTRVILLAVGLGAFFIVGIRSLQASLLDEFSLQVSADSADMFLLDVQRGQVDGMRAFLNDPANGAGMSRLIPVLRARSGPVRALQRSDERLRRLLERARPEHEHEPAGPRVLEIDVANARDLRVHRPPEDVEADDVADADGEALVQPLFHGDLRLR